MRRDVSEECLNVCASGGDLTKYCEYDCDVTGDAGVR